MGANRKTKLPDDLLHDLPDGSVFRAAFESSSTIMFLIDPESGRIIGANPAACEFSATTRRKWTASPPPR
jgi:PAS domain-containing protein